MMIDWRGALVITFLQKAPKTGYLVKAPLARHPEPLAGPRVAGVPG